jgi:hypothetical protein
MVGKSARYHAHYQDCLAKADTSPAPMRTLWLSVADSYRILMNLEDRFPADDETQWFVPRGRIDAAHSPGR